jgi:hypothetical protein
MRFAAFDDRRQPSIARPLPAICDGLDDLLLDLRQLLVGETFELDELGARAGVRAEDLVELQLARVRPGSACTAG